jgi:hypothetical protein
MIAYKDLETSQCYLERMKDSEPGLKYHLRQFQSRTQPSKMRDKPRTMYISDNNLSKFEVSVKCILFLEGRWLKISYQKLTPWSTVFLEKLIVTEVFNKFPAFYGTPKFTTLFTRARHWSLSWTRYIQFPPYISKIPFNITVPFTFTPSKWSLRFRFLKKKVRFPGLSRARYMSCPSHLDLVTLTTFGEECKSWNPSFSSSPTSCYFLPRISKYSSQLPVLIHRHFILIPWGGTPSFIPIQNNR